MGMKNLYWNYRIIFDPVSNSYSIHEVYYEDNKICSWTENGICPFGESLDELSKDFGMMKEAFLKPILEIKRDQNKEYLEEK